MREILYRAKTLGKGKWIFGIPRKTPLGNWLMRDNGDGAGLAIDPGTLGQSTGIEDIDGHVIFEGDTIRVSVFPTEYAVIYDSDRCSFIGVSGDGRRIHLSSYRRYTITGNIHDDHGKDMQ